MYLPQRNIYINDENRVMVDLNTYRIFYLTENLVQALQEKTFRPFTGDEEQVWKEIEKIEPLKSAGKIYYDTIKIHVSNSCNLNCKYCYANGGNYGFKDSLMKKETADKILAMIDEWEVFQKLEYVTFFGGEPLLDWEIIQYICEHTIHKKVKYLLQTNGTVLNDSILKLLKQYDICVTVSMDGPQEVHDFNRIDKKGKGTFQEVLRNVQKMKEYGVRVDAVQATLTSEFKDKYSKEEIADIIYQLTGIRRLKVEYDIADKNEENEKSRQQEVETFFDRVFKEKYILDNDAFKIMSVILCQKYNDFICSAGNRTITVDVTGKLFPCQMFLNNKLMCMGKVGEELFTGPAEILKKSRKDACRNCMARSTCYLCVAQEVNEKACCSKKFLTEKVLKYMTDLVGREKYLEFYDKFLKIY